MSCACDSRWTFSTVEGSWSGFERKWTKHDSDRPASQCVPQKRKILSITNPNVRLSYRSEFVSQRRKTLTEITRAGWQENRHKIAASSTAALSLSKSDRGTWEWRSPGLAKWGKQCDRGPHPVRAGQKRDRAGGGWWSRGRPRGGRHLRPRNRNDHADGLRHRGMLPTTGFDAFFERRAPPALQRRCWPSNDAYFGAGTRFGCGAKQPRDYEPTRHGLRDKATPKERQKVRR